ncbi:MAG: hypothetical protein M5U20_12305 [Phycisphaerales bacterium]|nr:hypothetical protein [Phycisphaerales bacterium]
MARTSLLLLVGVALFMLVTTAKAQWVRVVVTRHAAGAHRAAREQRLMSSWILARMRR